jgi:hypothetical protein
MALPRCLGILMLDTRFPRLPGDVGHPAAGPCRCACTVVQGASPQRVVQQADPALLRPSSTPHGPWWPKVRVAITTSCGFLVRWQAELQAALPVPVWTSSCWRCRACAPGVLTVDATS